MFYLAPGVGYIVGTPFGGRLSDYTVKKWIAKRGERIVEDRLRSVLPFVSIIIPVCMLLYGWSVQLRFGGIYLPLIMMFLQGVAQSFCMPSLNVHCIEVLPDQSANTVAGNYMTRFMFASVGSAVVLPIIEAIGVGWFSTITAGLVVGVAALLQITVMHGTAWREQALQVRLP